MISVNKLHIVGRRGRVPAETGSRRPYNIINKITIITGNWFPSQRVPADLPGIQYIHTYNIHTDNNKYHRVPVGMGSRREPVPIATGGDGFPPAGSGAGSRRNRFPLTGMHMYMGYWTYVRGK